MSTDIPIILAKDLGIPNFPQPRRQDWRIGMVGFGGIARAHAKAYQENGWKIEAVADPDPSARREAVEKFGVTKVYEDYAELIEDAEVEVIDLLTQPTLRLPVVREAMKAGKPLITEKPLGTSIEECLSMVELAESAGVPFAVHQNYRWYRNSYLAHHLITQGLIGKPYYMSVEIQGTQDVMLADHPFYSTCPDFLTIQWNNHIADLFRFWSGRDASRVWVKTSRMEGQHFVSDNLMLGISEFGPGLTGHIVHNELLRSSKEGVFCRVEGSEGTLLFDFHDEIIIDSRLISTGERRVDSSGLHMPPSFCATMGDFLSAIEDSRSPMVTAKSNLHTIRTNLAEHQSALEGGSWIEV
ncbi:Gfo/Idh/MocA family protein [Paenibacillus sp. GCM10023252]|uniref:Gfo/Idh/MocA family protein n=1 Tax=Paenibacillus sp. GCM10023252 TaxID=3252649 RepID=UPI0036101321